MRNLDTLLERAVAAWDERGWPRPAVQVVSGSGLAVDLGLAVTASEPLSALLPFAADGVIGHPLEVEVLDAGSGRTVLYQKGRLHSYQGFDADHTVFAVRLGALLGVRTLIMTNAAGGLDPGQRPGDLVLLRDHLNLTGLNPLRGDPPEAWGLRFPDLSDAYDGDLRRLARERAAALGLELGEGVYAGVAGPSYETPAEVTMLRKMGADLVGMSTVLEVIAARHMGVRCLCLSLVSNLAAGVAQGPLHHEEVLEAGRAAADKVATLLAALVRDPALVADEPR